MNQTISISWHVHDIQWAYSQVWKDDLTEQKAVEVLETLKANHDAMIGINWEVITWTLLRLKDEGCL